MGPPSRRLTVTRLGAPALRIASGVVARCSRGFASAVLILLIVAPAAFGQARTDTARVDTVPPGTSADSVRADTTSADTIFYNLPQQGGGVPTGWARGIWTWNAGEIQASGATNLAELVAMVPGMVLLRGGDYGTPLGISAFGLGGGRIRVLRDGIDVLPLEGGVADLARIGLGGIDQIRLERNPGELVITMRSLQHVDGRPYSLVEAGTGDLTTSLLRGTYADPTAFGGSIGLSLERSGTRGPRGNEPGNRNGSWVQYQLHRGNTAGLAVELHRMSNKTGLTAYYPGTTTRTDWDIRGSARLTPAVVVEAYAGKSIHKVDDGRPAYVREGGTVSQEGVLASVVRDSTLWGRGAYRHFGGAGGLPSSRIDLSAGGNARPGGFSVELDRAAWPGRTTSARRVRAWTTPILGVLTAFGSWESGTYGARVGPLEGPPLPGDTMTNGTPVPASPADSLGTTFRVTDRTAYRWGVEAQWRGFDLSWARLHERADSLLPLGLVFDRAQPALPGGTRTGWEALGSIPLVRGLHVEGSLQEWDKAWSYLPKRVYRGALVFHNTFMKTHDLEIWASVGVRGRDPMSVRQLQDVVTDSATGRTTFSLATVPFYQDWYGMLQIRVVTVRIFLAWDNIGLRPRLQDIPGRVLPLTRAVYGVRWTMWN